MYHVLQAAKDSFLLTRTKSWKQSYFGIPFDAVYYELYFVSWSFFFFHFSLLGLRPKLHHFLFFLYYDWLQKSVRAHLPCMALLLGCDPRLCCMELFRLFLVVVPSILHSVPVLSPNLFSFPLQTSVCFTHRSSDCASDKRGPLKLNPFPLLSLAFCGKIGATIPRYIFVLLTWMQSQLTHIWRVNRKPLSIWTACF